MKLKNTLLPQSQAFRWRSLLTVWIIQAFFYEHTPTHTSTYMIIVFAVIYKNVKCIYCPGTLKNKEGDILPCENTLTHFQLLCTCDMVEP